MTRRRLAALLLAALAAGPASAATGDTVRRVAAQTPHRIHDHAVWPGRGILLLAALRPPAVTSGDDGDESAEAAEAPAEGTTTVAIGTEGVTVSEDEPDDYDERPRRLLLLDGLPDAPRLRELRGDLPAAARTLVRVGDAFWLGAPGEVHRLAPTTDGSIGPPQRLLADPAVDLASAVAHDRLDAARGELAVIDVGELRRYALAGDRLELRERRPLPLRAERQRGALVLSTPPVTLLADGLVAVGPEAAGDRRLRVLLLREGEDDVEAWAQLPGPEKVVASRVVELGGVPLLVVTVRSADKLGIFEKARLRVVGLAADRSRAGRRPMLAVDTASRPWQAVETAVADADGDGDRDLVVLHEDGLGGDALLVETYLGDGRGGLRPSQSVADKVKLEDSAWHYGDDMDGDGRPDVVLRTRERLLVVRGEPGKKRLLARDSWLDVDLAASDAEPPTTVYVEGGPDTGAGYAYVRPASRPYAVDVDGDGRREILLRTRADDGAEGVLWISPWGG